MEDPADRWSGRKVWRAATAFLHKPVSDSPFLKVSSRLWAFWVALSGSPTVWIVLLFLLCAAFFAWYLPYGWRSPVASLQSAYLEKHWTLTGSGSGSLFTMVFPDEGYPTQSIVWEGHVVEAVRGRVHAELKFPPTESRLAALCRKYGMRIAWVGVFQYGSCDCEFILDNPGNLPLVLKLLAKESGVAKCYPNVPAWWGRFSA